MISALRDRKSHGLKMRKKAEAEVQDVHKIEKFKERRFRPAIRECRMCAKMIINRVYGTPLEVSVMKLGDL